VQPSRLIAVFAAGLVLLGLLAVGTRTAGVDDTADRAPEPGPTTAARTTAPAPKAFAGRLLVYANDALRPAQVRAVRAATAHDVVAVALYEDNVASGRPHYPDVPVLTMVTDARAYASVIGVPAMAGAFAHGAVLAATEARLRHVAVGGVVRFADGRRVPVTAVVEDHLLGGNEMSLPAGVSRMRGRNTDYLLVADGGDAGATGRGVRRALRATKVRVEARTENGYMSSADRVLTQLQVKARYGEFAMRRTGRTTFVQDPGWVNRYLVTTHVQQLGRVTCNRVILPALRAAMREITRRGLGATVHTADFQYEGGCWNPNVIPGAQGTISRHSWGLAVDVNVDANSFGYRPHQDGRLVSVMRGHGFTWGGRWLMPDGMHFEFAQV
jgi:hypothetical protein